MARTIDVHAGTRLPGPFQDNDLYQLLPTPPGATHLPIIVPGSAEGVRIIGVEGPDRTLLDAGRAEFGIRGNDGCNGLSISGIHMLNAGHGIRVTHADEVRIEDIAADGHAVEAVHLSFCQKATVRRIYGRRLGTWSFQDYGAHQAHLVYAAGVSDGSVFEDLCAEEIGGSLFQANAASTRDHARGLTVRRALGRKCGQGGSGTLAFALMGVLDSLFELWRLEDCHGIATLFADGKGPGYACSGNRFQNGSLVRTPAEFRQQDGSGGNLFSLGAGWATAAPALPGSPVVVVSPTPPPPPPPDDPTADLRARLAAAEARAKQAEARIAAAQKALAGGAP